MTTPSISVEPNVAVPAKYNLLDTVGTMALPDHAGYGIEVEEINCGLGARTWYTPCEDVADPDDKIPDDGRMFSEFGPINVYHLFKCRTVGSWAMGEEFARRALDLGASFAIEQFLATKFAADGVTSDATEVTDKASLIAAVASMEQQWAAEQSGARAVFHLDRYWATIGLEAGLFEKVSDHLETGLGSLVIAGAGYASTPAVTVTGHVTVFEGATIVPGPLLDMPYDNEFTALAERLYVPTYECGALTTAIGDL